MLTAALLCLAATALDRLYLLLLANLSALLLGVGALGEYVGRIYVERKHRPLCTRRSNRHREPDPPVRGIDTGGATPAMPTL